LNRLPQDAAAVIFALALLFSGFSSSITAGMAGGSIFAGIYQEPFNMSDRHSRIGVYITLFLALGIILFVRDPFQGLLWSQVILSIQLPFTVIPLILLTSSSLVMGKYANSLRDKVLLGGVAAAVIFLNVKLLIQLAGG
jgi:manganese transport protein